MRASTFERASSSLLSSAASSSRMIRFVSCAATTTAAVATIMRAPVGPPPSLPNVLGHPCWRARADVYSLDRMPTVIGTLEMFSPEFAAFDEQKKTACRILKSRERSRGNRTLMVGEIDDVTLITAPLGSTACSGSFFVEGETRVKRLLM